jgi:hypothetical protein
VEGVIILTAAPHIATRHRSRRATYCVKTNPSPLASSTTRIARVMSKPREASRVSTRPRPSIVNVGTRCARLSPMCSSVSRLSVKVGMVEARVLRTEQA